MPERGQAGRAASPYPSVARDFDVPDGLGRNPMEMDAIEAVQARLGSCPQVAFRIAGNGVYAERRASPVKNVNVLQRERGEYAARREGAVKENAKTIRMCQAAR